MKEHEECYDGCVERNDDDTEPGGDAKPLLRRQLDVDREQGQLRKAVAHLIDRGRNVCSLAMLSAQVVQLRD